MNSNSIFQVEVIFQGPLKYPSFAATPLLVEPTCSSYALVSIQQFWSICFHLLFISTSLSTWGSLDWFPTSLRVLLCFCSEDHIQSQSKEAGKFNKWLIEKRREKRQWERTVSIQKRNAFVLNNYQQKYGEFVAAKYVTRYPATSCCSEKSRLGDGNGF